MQTSHRELHLHLYVVGRTPRAERAVANLQKICGRDLDRCEITIIDVLEQPEMAETHKVIATPTLVKCLPPPTRRIIGDLSDIQRVANLLGLNLGEPSSETFGPHEEGAL
jgi:circadian clock protein KaiB